MAKSHRVTKSRTSARKPARLVAKKRAQTDRRRPARSAKGVRLSSRPRRGAPRSPPPPRAPRPQHTRPPHGCKPPPPPPPPPAPAATATQETDVSRGGSDVRARAPGVAAAGLRRVGRRPADRHRAL